MRFYSQRSEPEPEPVIRDVQPTVLRSESGLEIRFETCPVCGHEVTITKSPRLFIAGQDRFQCPVCEKRQRLARERLQTRRATIDAVVEERLKASAEARSIRVDAEIAEMVKAHRCEIERRLRWQDARSFRVAAEEEELARILEELREGEN